MATQLALGTLPPTILPLPQPPKPSSIVTIIEGDPIYVTQPSSLPSFNLLDSTCLNFLTMANERLSSITTTLQAMPRIVFQFLKVIVFPMWSQAKLDNIKSIIESHKNLGLQLEERVATLDVFFFFAIFECKRLSNFVAL